MYDFQRMKKGQLSSCSFLKIFCQFFLKIAIFSSQEPAFPVSFRNILWSVSFSNLCIGGKRHRNQNMFPHDRCFAWRQILTSSSFSSSLATKGSRFTVSSSVHSKLPGYPQIYLFLLCASYGSCTLKVICTRIIMSTG